MKADELREMNIKELRLKEEDLREEYFNLRFQKIMQRLENPTKIKDVKRDIARVKTLIHEKELEQQKQKK